MLSPFLLLKKKDIALQTNLNFGERKGKIVIIFIKKERNRLLTISFVITYPRASILVTRY